MNNFRDTVMAALAARSDTSNVNVLDAIVVVAEIFNSPIRESRTLFEQLYFIQRLQDCDYKIAKLALVCGMERTHLYRKLRTLGIDTKRPDIDASTPESISTDTGEP